VNTKKYAAGITRKKAYKRIENIEHEVAVLDSNRIVIGDFYQYPKSDCLRRQKVVVEIKVPKGADVEWIGEVKKSYFIEDSRLHILKSR
jgi:hypothetical protein